MSRAENGEVTLEEQDLFDGEYYYAFILTDIFGQTYESDAISLFMEGDEFYFDDGLVSSTSAYAKSPLSRGFCMPLQVPFKRLADTRLKLRAYSDRCRKASRGKRCFNAKG